MWILDSGKEEKKQPWPGTEEDVCLCLCVRACVWVTTFSIMAVVMSSCSGQEVASCGRVDKEEREICWKRKHQCDFQRVQTRRSMSWRQQTGRQIIDRCIVMWSWTINPPSCYTLASFVHLAVPHYCIWFWLDKAILTTPRLLGLITWKYLWENGVCLVFLQWWSSS